MLNITFWGRLDSRCLADGPSLHSTASHDKASLPKLSVECVWRPSRTHIILSNSSPDRGADRATFRGQAHPRDIWSDAVSMGKQEQRDEKDQLEFEL